jgi:uncharacterized membrane protein
VNARSYPILFGTSALGMMLLGTFALSLGIQHALPLSDPRAALPPLLAAAAGSVLIVVSGFVVLRFVRTWADEHRRQSRVAREHMPAEQTPAASLAVPYEDLHSQAVHIARQADEIEHDRAMRRKGQGVFPSPAMLEGYRTFGPELVERVVIMAEREQRQRHWRERAPERTARLGITFGLMIGISGLVTSGYLAAIGLPVAAAVLGATDLLGLVGVFIYGSRQQPSPLQSSHRSETPHPADVGDAERERAR